MVALSSFAVVTVMVTVVALGDVKLTMHIFILFLFFLKEHKLEGCFLGFVSHLWEMTSQSTASVSALEQC